jgi:bifunctional DNase/RNase
MVRMKVKVVGLEQHTLSPVVIITDLEEKGFIPIQIGPGEAAAISQGLEGKKMPRPFTHDLLTNVIGSLEAKVEWVVIYDLKEETYYAKIHFKTKTGEELDVEARPSDAIALALRTKPQAPIYISEEIAAKAIYPNVSSMDEELEEFREFLQNLTPDDFKQNRKE